MNGLAGDLTGARRGKEQHGCGDVIRRASALGRGLADQRFPPLGGQVAPEELGGLDEAGSRAQEAGLVLRLSPEPRTRLVQVELTGQGHRRVEEVVSSLLSYEQA